VIGQFDVIDRYLNEIKGIVTGGVDIVCSTACDWSRFDSTNKRHCCDKIKTTDCNTELNGEVDDDDDDDDDDDVDDDVTEPYTSERLVQLRSGFKFLSSPAPLLSFNFTNMQVRL